MEDFSQYNGEGTTLRKVQLRLVDILVEIDKICRRHNIQYWLDFGTLLGAVRHKGFIPWDDDVDIAMPTDDLKRFIALGTKELPSSLFIQTKISDPSFRRDIVRVRDKNTLFITPQDDFSIDYNKGMFVDIFEVQPYPNINRKFQKFIFKCYTKANYFFCFKQRVTLKNHIAAITFPIIILSFNIFWTLSNLKRKNKIGYKKQINNAGYSYTKDTIYPLKEITFENHLFFAPADTDRYLTCIWKDYMQIPPKEKRQTHMKYVSFNF